MRLAFAEGKRRIIVAHATGTGKTVLFARILRKRGGRALILAHREELILQAHQKLLDVDLPSSDIGIVKAERKETDKPIVIASVQTLVNCLPALLAHGSFETVVVDECHHALATTYRTILDVVATPDTLVLGVTATPFRGKPSEGLGDIFESVAHTYSIADAISEGYLAPIIAKSVKLAGADYTKLKMSHGDISESSAARVLFDAHAPEQIARALREFARDRVSLIFAPTVEVAEAIETSCRDAGLSSASIFGHTPSDLRHATLARFGRGQLQTLVNCGVLTEGYDEARIDCVAMARPTKSQVLFTQCIGRGTRLHPDKTNLLVLDFVGATHRHDLMSMSTILPQSVTPQMSRGDIPRSGESPLDWLYGGTIKPGAPADASLIATTVDLFATRPFAWIKTAFGYVLDCGRELGWVTMRQGSPEGAWTVTQLREGTMTPLWTGASFSYAQAHGEAWVTKAGAATLARREAPWRKGEMTEGQARALTAWKVPHTVHWTRGRASDALTRAIAEAHYRKALS